VGNYIGEAGETLERERERERRMVGVLVWKGGGVGGDRMRL
jgi:hypothetical protein